MKRILCLLSGMNAGGAETFLMKVYRNIDRTKYQMDFCINVKEHCFYEDEINNLGGLIHRIPTKSENVKEFQRQLANVVRDYSYDRVLRITSNAMGFMDLKIAKKAGARICIARSSNASDGSGMKSKIAHRVGRALYSKYVDVRLAPSDLAAKYTFGEKAYKAGQVAILHNGVDLNTFRYDPNVRKKVRNEFSCSSEMKLIGHVGRFDEQKNHMFLLEIFRKINLKDSNTKLILVGQGKLEDQIRQKALDFGIIDHIVFTGVRSDVPALLSAMDVFVMPSFYEGMPNTVVEAQATGLPCVIADTITAEANITGLVRYLPLGDSDAWAEAALSAIASERADTHASFMEYQYDIESVTKEFIRIIFGDI